MFVQTKAHSLCAFPPTGRTGTSYHREPWQASMPKGRRMQPRRKAQARGVGGVSLTTYRCLLSSLAAHPALPVLVPHDFAGRFPPSCCHTPGRSVPRLYPQLPTLPDPRARSPGTSLLRLLPPPCPPLPQLLLSGVEGTGNVRPSPRPLLYANLVRWLPGTSRAISIVHRPKSLRFFWTALGNLLGGSHLFRVGF